MRVDFTSSRFCVRKPLVFPPQVSQVLRLSNTRNQNTIPNCIICIAENTTHDELYKWNTRIFVYIARIAEEETNINYNILINFIFFGVTSHLHYRSCRPRCSQCSVQLHCFPWNHFYSSGTQMTWRNPYQTACSTACALPSSLIGPETIKEINWNQNPRTLMFPT